MSAINMSMLRLRGELRNPALRTAVEALDGYANALAIAEQAIRRRDEHTPQPSGAPAEIQNVLTAGEIPEDYVKRMAEHEKAVADQKAAYVAFDNLRDQALARCKRIITASVDRLLTHLNGQLTNLIDEAQAPATTLRDTQTADEAIRAGAEAIAAFGQLDDIWRRYREIRDAQLHVLQHYVSHHIVERGRNAHCRDELANDHFIANLDEVFPGWRNGSHDRGPWPEPGPLQLKWLICNSDAQLWVPTERQIEQLWTDRSEARRTHISKKLEHPRTQSDMRRMAPRNGVTGEPVFQPARDWPTSAAELTR